MSKRARKMALMGFVSGALQDVVRTRERQRLEEADARKEARLASIRAQERGEDREWTREQFAAQQAALDKRDDKNFGQQKEMYGIQSAEADKRDERNFAQQRQLAGESRAHAERLASGRSAPSRAPNIETYLDADGRAHNFDVNDAADLQRFKRLNQSSGLVPYSATTKGQRGTAAPKPDFSDVRGTPEPMGAGAKAGASQAMPRPQAQSGPARITSPDAYSKLPSGSRYIAPDGSMRVKP